MPFSSEKHQGFIHLLALLVVCRGVIVLSHILFPLRWPFRVSGGNQRVNCVVFYDKEKHCVVQEN